jgi:hypothetical protein
MFMKSNIQISLFSLLLVLGSMLTACQVIPQGEQILESFTPADTSQIKRASLLIEYSGWRCMNCPNAAAVAHDLQEQYGEQLVVVVMHPATNPNTRYGNNQAVNYTCPEADSVYLKMGGTNATPFPTGNINFQQQDNSYFTGSDTWATQMSRYYVSSPIIMSQTVTHENNTVDIELYLCNMGSSTLNATLQIWLTEDGVVGRQYMPDGKTNNEYTHNHLMRATVLPSVWGESCQLPSITPQTLHFRYTLPEKVVAENCNIVSILSTGDMVIQATETSVQ